MTTNQICNVSNLTAVGKALKDVPADVIMWAVVAFGIKKLYDLANDVMDKGYNLNVSADAEEKRVNVSFTNGDASTAK